MEEQSLKLNSQVWLQSFRVHDPGLTVLRCWPAPRTRSSGVALRFQKSSASVIWNIRCPSRRLGFGGRLLSLRNQSAPVGLPGLRGDWASSSNLSCLCTLLSDTTRRTNEVDRTISSFGRGRLCWFVTGDQLHPA